MPTSSSAEMHTDPVYAPSILERYRATKLASGKIARDNDSVLLG